MTNERQIRVVTYYNSDANVLALAVHPATGLDSYRVGDATEESTLRVAAAKALAEKLDLLEVPYELAN